MEPSEISKVAWFQAEFGYTFTNTLLLEQALRHRSTQNEKPMQAWQAHNERLEFLGDAILSAVISWMLFQRFPEAREGDLSHWRSSLVNLSSLRRIGQEHGLGPYLELGKGESQSGGREKESIIGNSFEALIGAVFIDGGDDAVRHVIENLFYPLLAEIEPHHLIKDYKSMLQERLQANSLPLPTYQTIEISGPPHARDFLVACLVNGVVHGTGNGRNKRHAEQQAAQAAFLAWDNRS